MTWAGERARCHRVRPGWRAAAARARARSASPVRTRAPAGAALPAYAARCPRGRRLPRRAGSSGWRPGRRGGKGAARGRERGQGVCRAAAAVTQGETAAPNLHNQLSRLVRARPAAHAPPTHGRTYCGRRRAACGVQGALPPAACLCRRSRSTGPARTTCGDPRAAAARRAWRGRGSGGGGGARTTLCVCGGGGSAREQERERGTRVCVCVCRSPQPLLPSHSLQPQLCQGTHRIRSRRRENKISRETLPNQAR